jgi:hypothetical protein
MKSTIVRMSKLLTLSENPFDLAEAVPHDEESFYWTASLRSTEIVEEQNGKSKTQKRRSRNAIKSRGR